MWEVIKIGDYWRVRRDRYLVSTHRTKLQAKAAMVRARREDKRSVFETGYVSNDLPMG